jgi:putative proteasome-type protease
MTYCLAIKVDRGLIFCSDSRTNAGVDDVSKYSKMHTFLWPGNRIFVMLSAGNLATTQAVVKRLNSDARTNVVPSLLSIGSMHDAADHVGTLNTAIQRQQASRYTANTTKTNFEATFIFGGQIVGMPPEIYMIYPQGNCIHESREHPYLQLGETKYGKPILDRVIQHDTTVDQAARCALVSMDSSIRANLTVGPPVELLVYECESLTADRRLNLPEDDPFAREIQKRWNEGLLLALQNLPLFAWEQPAAQDAVHATGQVLPLNANR